MRVQTQQTKVLDLPEVFERTPISILAVFLFNPGLTAEEYYKRQFFSEKSLLSIRNLCILLYREGILRMGTNNEAFNYYPTAALQMKVLSCGSHIFGQEEIMKQPVVDANGYFDIEEWEDIF